MNVPGMQDSTSIRTIGKYKILGTLGRGSMGVVYRAQDPEIGRIVAIKVIRNTAAQQPMGAQLALERFKVEARAAGNLRHPHIITVFDVNIDQDSPYIVMDYIEGESLAQIISRNSKLDPRQAIHYLWQIASGLDHAHSRGVIHRDIKPSNILIDRSDSAFILDFGVASFGDKPRGEDMILGTPSYMSPEQIVNKQPTAYSDIFSFAVMAFECFTGVKPFPGENFSAVVNNILNSHPLSITDLNPELPMTLESEFDKALAKQPEKRFSSAEQMVNAFSHALGLSGPSSGAYTVSSSKGAARKRKMSDWRSLTALKGDNSNPQNLPGLYGKPAARQRKKTFGTASPWRQPEHRSVKADAFAMTAPVSHQALRPGSLYATADNEIRNAPLVVNNYRIFTMLFASICLLLSALLAWKILAGSGQESHTESSESTISMSSQHSFENAATAETRSLPRVEKAPAGMLAVDMSDKQLLGALIADDTSEVQLLEAMREARRRALPAILDVCGYLLKNDSYIVRIEILKILAELADPKVVSQVVYSLDDHDPLVRRWSAKTLAKIGDRRAVGYLQSRLQREDLEDVKADIRKALEKITGIPYVQ